MTKTTFKLGDLKIDAQAYGSQGNAILGIRDSGKTYTATEIAEKLFEAGIPFITFDPTGVWRWLRVPGKGRGYPVVVAGGQARDLPLTVAGAVEIVRAAMNNGVSLVIDLTDPNLSKADWKRIVKSCVRALLQENAPHGLRHIFIEEAAEFVPQRVLDGDVYAEVEKLARIGGNSRLGYTLINQRSQEVNKAVLELCENLFLHRQRGKNAILSLDHWFDVAGVDKTDLVKSLPRLPSGQCWAWMGDRELPHLIQVPPKNSFHPDRRTMHGAKGKRSRKAVNVGSFVKDMRAALVSLEAEATANDPVLLRKEIATLKAERDRLAKAKGAADPDTIKDAENRGYGNGYGKGKIDGYAAAIAGVQAEYQAVAAATEPFEAMFKNLRASAAAVENWAKRAAKHPPKIIPAPRASPAPVTGGAPKRLAATPPLAKPSAAASGDGNHSGPALRVLRSLAMWQALGHDAPSREMVAAGAGYKPTTGNFGNLIGGLATSGAIGKPAPGRLQLLVDGFSMDMDEGRDMLLQTLNGPQKRIIAALIDQGARSREDLAAATGYQPGTGNFGNLIGSLNRLGVTCKPGTGQVALSDWAQELLSGYDAVARAA